MLHLGPLDSYSRQPVMKRDRKLSKSTDVPAALICLNCDHSIEPTKQVRFFCSEACKDEAKFVRYFRRCNRDGRLEQPDVQEAIEMRFAHIMAGGYNARVRRISPSLRAAVIERDRGLCRTCGQPGTDIDHIAGDSSDMENLQLLCKSCHNKKTKGQIMEISPEDERYTQHMEKAQGLYIRCESRLPRRLCDDDEQWPQQYKRVMTGWRKSRSPNS